MNKMELVEKVAEKLGKTKKESHQVVEAVISSIKEALANGEEVQLVGFGSFKIRKRSARKGRNPQTGEEIHIPEAKVPAFRAGKALKEAVR